MTPPALARALVEHFPLSGRCLDPCRGSGAFFDAMKARAKRQKKLGVPDEDRIASVDWCELGEGRDFLADNPGNRGEFSWIVTNPPWSQIAAFMERAFTMADNVVFLATINHAFTSMRRRLAAQSGFSLVGIVEFDWPKKWAKSGFQLGAMHYAKRRKVEAWETVVELCHIRPLDWKDDGQGGRLALPADAGLDLGA